MKQQFKDYLIKVWLFKATTANSYSDAISKISEHYSRNTANKMDIFAITDQAKINQITDDYIQTGKFLSFGYEDHGLN